MFSCIFALASVGMMVCFLFTQKLERDKKSKSKSNKKRVKKNTDQKSKYIKLWNFETFKYDTFKYVNYAYGRHNFKQTSGIVPTTFSIDLDKLHTEKGIDSPFMYRFKREYFEHADEHEVLEKIKQCILELTDENSDVNIVSVKVENIEAPKEDTSNVSINIREV